MLTKEVYFLKHFQIYPFLRIFKKKMDNLRLVGKLITIYFALERMPFYYAGACRTNFSKLTRFRRRFATQEFVCVGYEKKWLATTIRLRFIDERVLGERKFFIFSPLIYTIKPKLTSGVNRLVVIKSKLYYFDAKVIKKYLNMYYYS